MHANEATLTRFYTAFAALDADTLAACDADDAIFDNPVFSLRGRRETGGMWRMLCAAINSRAHWEAHYRFSATGRLVHNIIDAQFSFNPDGLIATHRDHFDFWRWSRQALGTPGLLLGWTPWLRAKVRQQASANLNKFLAGKA